MRKMLCAVILGGALVAPQVAQAHYPDKGAAESIFYAAKNYACGYGASFCTNRRISVACNWLVGSHSRTCEYVYREYNPSEGMRTMLLTGQVTHDHATDWHTRRRIG